GIPRQFAATLGWVGLAAVAGTAFTLTTATPFPGSVALIPALGTAAVIASGPAAGPLGPVRVLGLLPMRWIGGLSYSLYLWHWPLIVLAAARLGEPLTLSEGLAVVLATFLPAYLSYRFVEEPVRRARPLVARPKLALRMGLACTLIGVFSGLGLLATTRTAPSIPTASVPLLPAGDPARQAETPKFGAEVLGERPLGHPLGAAVTTVRACAHGDPGSKSRILVLGDSHAQQWMPALKAIAGAENLRVVSHAKVSCPFVQGQVSRGSQPYTSCTEWNRNVRRTLAAEARPDLVILTNRMFAMVENGRVLTGRANAAKVADALRSAIRE